MKTKKAWKTRWEGNYAIINKRRNTDFSVSQNGREKTPKSFYYLACVFPFLSSFLSLMIINYVRKKWNLFQHNFISFSNQHRNFLFFITFIKLSFGWKFFLFLLILTLLTFFLIFLHLSVCVFFATSSFLVGFCLGALCLWKSD